MMRTYRLDIRGFRRIVRHVRAVDVEDARRQARDIADALEPGEIAAVLGSPVVDIALVDERRRRP